MRPIRIIRSQVIPLNINNIDTDQIIPARYLKTIDKSGLGKQLFADWRYLPDGSPNPEFPLNQQRYNGASILLAGENFGCGSSREHAPWALMAYGIRAVIALSFADIFHNNALKNGLLPVQVNRDDHQMILDMTQELIYSPISIDLENQLIYLPILRTVAFDIDPFSKNCLLKGMDDLDYIQSFSQQIEEFEKKHFIPYQ